MVSVIIEQRIVVKFHFKLGKTATETYNLLKEVYGSECLSRARVFEWFKRFKDGRQDVEDDSRPGRPSTSKTDENVEKVASLIRSDRRLSIPAIAETVNIDKECVRQILHDNLNMQKVNCDENKTVVNTSLKSVQTSHDVNLRITQAFSHIGKGYSAIEKFCMVMNIDPFSSTTYGKCARRLDNAYTLASENIFAEIHREIKNVYENGAEITDLSVSFDGTWLTRGHTSLIGVGCVIDMLTGYVVDFEVMSKVCRHCSVAKNARPVKC
ncbi:protein GVQW3 [Trichonephila clavipes]|nr:protein GVQW3 [Trichonephila clavipes]